jgi:hypothetical protein
MQGIITVTIRNWKKYNYRIDLKKPSWFRFENSFFEEPDLYSLNLEEISVFIYLLCLASKKNEETISINKDHAKIVARIPEKTLLAAISKLKALDKITYADVTSTSHTRDDHGLYMTNKQTNKTNNAQSEEIERELTGVYLNYPRKRGKQQGMKIALKEIKTPEDLDLFKKAVENYKKDMTREKRPEDKILYFSSFMAQWKDWILVENKEQQKRTFTFNHESSY